MNHPIRSIQSLVLAVSMTLALFACTGSDTNSEGGFNNLSTNNAGAPSGTFITDANDDIIPPDPGNLLPAVTQPIVVGSRRLLVAMVNFENSRLSATQAQLHDAVFGSTNSVDGMFRETSYGLFGIEGDVVGPLTISSALPANPGCYCRTYRERGETALRASGVNIDNYDAVLYVFATGAATTCGVGRGELNGRFAYVVELYGAIPQDAIAHELGHTLLGFMHGNGSDLHNIYNDESTNMGIAQYTLRTFNAPNRIQAGWLPAANIVTIDRDGTYTVNSLDAPGSGPQAFVIAQQSTGDSPYGTMGNLYISYRQAIGYASALSSGWTDVYRVRYDQRLNIHRWDPLGDPFSGCRPWGMTSLFDTKFRSSLVDGERFSEDEYGVKIRQISHTQDSATFEVRFVTAQARDAEKPVISNIVEQGDPQNGVRTTDASVTVTARDNIGVASVSMEYIRITPTREILFDTITLVNPPYVFSLPLGTAGPISIYAKDLAGNKSGDQSD